MSNYYSKQDAKVRIAEELFSRGWTVYGFKEDQSDSMTDYYSPANWGGIAEKNGYILVVDNRFASEGRDITKYNPNYVSMTAADTGKIEALKNMTVEKGTTAGEEENAKKLIEKIQSKYSNEGVSKWEVVGRIPGHMANSKGCIWHIEKDGALVDKGNKLTVFASVPESYIFNINTMQFNERYQTCINWEDGERKEVKRELTEKEEKAIKEFKTFILRIERAVNGQNSCGDGTAETEKAAQEQADNEKMEKAIIEKKKIVVKLQEVERTGELKVDDIIYVSGYGNCKVYEIDERLNMYRAVKLGSKTRGYQESKVMSGKVNLNKKSFDNSLNRGYLKVGNLVSVEEVEKIEKWVKVKAKKTTKKTTVKTPDIAEEIVAEKEETKENNINVEVKFNEEKKGIELYFTDKPSEKVREGLKVNGFRWSKYNKCWYVKDSEEARKYLNQIGFTGEEQGEKISLDSSGAEEIEVNTIEFDSIEQYKISKELSKRENDCHWVFRSKERNHTQEIQNHFIYCKDELLEVLNNTDNIYIKNSAIRFFNSYMKKYSDLFTKMIRNRSDMPSVAVAGAGNYNFKRMNKNNDRYGNLLNEYTTLTESFKDKIASIKQAIKKEENKRTSEKINVYMEAYEDIKTTKETVRYNPSAVDNIFDNATSETIAYKHKDYYIIKNWGAFKVYDNNGNMQYIEKIPCSCATLKDAKLFLSYMIDNNDKKVA